MTAAADPRPPLDPERLAAFGHSAGRGLQVEIVDTAPSTNAVVAERARHGAPHGLVVVAEHQTAGRGRLDRAWETPARAALTFSVLLRPQVPAAQWPWLPLLAGHALAIALREAEVPAGLKWPNDVLVGERKVAGILLERVETGDGPAAVLGVGLNVSTTEEELPVDTATSVALATGSAPDRTELLTRLLGRLVDEYDAWQADEARTVTLASAYTDVCVTVGREVRVELPGGTVRTGTAQGIDPGGRLVVDGVALGVGDVVHVRPAR
ncbi:biotin--[acetyl-CoA-carboxylase] ligase [Nocardioides sp.]|uniref:biotin--[acetyl-CoA-carboxylase] ligase n=1 Tax=Nocardioides sp. TaxID=35761 RepID=UPI002D7F4DE7|nr:biotin--[acetyl-CoA-carboxylase] ligase [Nocardioides sp.]HET8959278.1 biotin--[acetyl-CoA-carboxylase] ligase [Nocardioides sp.]